MAEKTGFLPFNAINEFMRPDFRLSIIREVLNNLPNLSKEISSTIAHVTRKDVKIPGFRNSEKAPALLKSLPYSKAFENSPNLVAATLAAWTEIHSTLQSQVFATLTLRNWPRLDGIQDFSLDMINADFIKTWPILPLLIDRSRLPGFNPRWPKNENFEELYKTFTNLFPESDASLDKVSLMVVWITLRLPYEMDEEIIPTAIKIDVES